MNKLTMQNSSFYRLVVYVVFSIALLKGDITIADSDIVVALEEPANGSTYSGISNIRGWAVALQPIQKIELYIDSIFRTNIPIGGRRTDVGAAYPTYPDSTQSGFSMAMNYSELTAGQHVMLVRVVDSYGGAHNVSANFNVTRFDNPFIYDPAKIELYNANILRENSTIVIKGVIADGKNYDVRLNWQPATQGFAISQITPQSGGGGSGGSGIQGLGVSVEWKGVVFTPQSLVTEKDDTYRGDPLCRFYVKVQNNTSKCMSVYYKYKLYNHSFDHSFDPYGGYIGITHFIPFVPTGSWSSSTIVTEVSNCNGFYRIDLDNLVVDEFLGPNVPCNFID